MPAVFKRAGLESFIILALYRLFLALSNRLECISVLETAPSLITRH